jgi:hypothetical protein
MRTREPGAEGIRKTIHNHASHTCTNDKTARMVSLTESVGDVAGRSGENWLRHGSGCCGERTTGYVQLQGSTIVHLSIHSVNLSDGPLNLACLKLLASCYIFEDLDDNRMRSICGY